MPAAVTRAAAPIKHETHGIQPCPHVRGQEVCIEHGVCRHYACGTSTADCHHGQRCEYGLVNALIRVSRELAELRAEMHSGRPVGTSVG